jgi:L-ascorbate metabolism protein UlaG (beta-lactamase superfamily)
MIITWCGHSCFKIQSKTSADGITVVTDPFDKKTGLKVPSFEADIVTISHDHHDHNNVSAIKGKPYVIRSAGEYDVKGVAVHGVDSYHDVNAGKERGINIIYKITIDDISVCHLGDLGQDLDDKQLEALAGTDILLIPIGGKYTIDAKKAVEVINQVEPRIIIPMHYFLPGLTIQVDGVEKFVKELGLSPRKEEKLKITKKDLPQEEMDLVILSA